MPSKQNPNKEKRRPGSGSSDNASMAARRASNKFKNRRVNVGAVIPVFVKGGMSESDKKHFGGIRETAKKETLSTNAKRGRTNSGGSGRKKSARKK